MFSEKLKVKQGPVGMILLPEFSLYLYAMVTNTIHFDSTAVRLLFTRHKVTVTKHISVCWSTSQAAPTNLFTYLDLTTAAQIHTDRSINSRLTIDYDQSTISHGKWTFEFNNNVLMPTGFVLVGQ